MPEMDWRKLLRKYIQHVTDNEGISFLEDGSRRRNRDCIELSDEEWTALRELESEPLEEE
jgi:hypothetical protein